MHALYNAVLILYYPSESFRASPGSAPCFSSIVYSTWKYVGCSCNAFDGHRAHSRNAYMNEWWKYLSSFVKEVKSTRVTEFVKTFPLSISWWTYNVLFFISTFLEQVTSSEWKKYPSFLEVHYLCRFDHMWVCAVFVSICYRYICLLRCPRSLWRARMSPCVIIESEAKWNWNNN